MATERTVLVRLKANVGDFVRGMGTAQAVVKGLTSDIDTSNDRAALLAQSFLALAPTISPLGAAAVPVFTGIATQMTIASVAAGTAALAFNGVGDALKALNDYQIEPTEAHLKKLNETMAKVGPDGAEFVRFLDQVGDQLSDLADTSRAGLFPGVQAGIESLLTLLPQVRRIVSETSTTLGQLASEGGEGLAGPRFAEFFQFLETDAQPILVDMGRSIGNIVDGLAAMLVAFAPLSADFSSGFAEMTQDFANWAHALDSSESFQDFVNYVQESVPKALDLLAAIADAVLQIVEAAAPIGDIMLPAFTAVLNVVSAIADSPLGPIFIGAAAAASIYGRAVALASITTSGLIGKLGLMALGMNRVKGSQTNLITSMVSFRRAAVGTATVLGTFAFAQSGLAEKAGVANAATLALAGSIGGPLGTAVGFTTGLLLDMKNAAAETGDVLTRAENALATGTFEEQSKAMQDLLAEASRLANDNSFGANVSRIFAFGPGEFQERSASLLEQYTNNAKLAGNETGDLSTLLTQNFGPAVRDSAAALQLAAGDGTDFANSLAAINENLTKTDAFLAYKQSILNVKDALAQNGPGVDANTEKGLANLRALQALAHDVVAVLNTLPEGSRRDQFAIQATNQIRNLANQLDPSGKAAKDLLADLNLLETKPPVKPKIGANTTEFERQAAKVQQMMDALSHQTVTVEMRAQIDQVTADLMAFLQLFPGGSRNHRPVTGGHQAEGHAEGGWTGPGSKYTPAGTVHADEFVFSKEATHGNVRFLESLHSQMRGYSNGGHVPATGGGADIRQAIGELAQQVAQMRPIYGDVHLQPHDYNEFRREMDADRARASLDGVPRPGGM